MSKKCPKMTCFIHILAKSLNILLLLGALFGFAQAYSFHEKLVFLLVGLVPLISLIALSKKGDREERHLQARIRKANLRKELDELKQFDKQK